MNLTPAQERALRWLPEDGTWIRLPQPSHIVRMLHFLTHALRLAEDQWSWEHPMGFAWRLTPAGIAERKRREEA